nr:LLM class F420-dependent oxidoreductase [bacterium]
MHIGAVFPQIEIGSDRAAVRAWTETAEGLGFDSILVYEHVLGADPSRHVLTGPYTHEDGFHEPFVLFGYMAGITTRIELWLGVLVLPQRQTALVAKQAATLDLLSGERFTLGVGVGWNQVEFQALGQDFRTRGRRFEEQVQLLNKLWAQELVDFDGEFDTVEGAGINHLPNRRIPLWIGGWADPVMKRIGWWADGWLASAGSVKTAHLPDRTGNTEGLRNRFKLVEEAAREKGRDPAEIGLGMLVGEVGFTGRVGWDPAEYAERTRVWGTAGVSHAFLGTMGYDFTVDEHLSAMEDFMAAYRNGG